jgi:hypothetical protein
VRIVAMSRLAEQAIDGGCYAPGRRYPVSCALRMASTPSSTLSSGVVLNVVAAPPAAMAIENAAASVFSGSSTTPTMSYSPKASQACSNFPPSFSTTGRTASSRFCGCLTMAAHASEVYAN